MSIRLTVLDNIKRIAEEQQKHLAPLSDDLVLTESGLDSLCFAILVARLDAELGLDPFTTEEDIVFPVTVGDFVRLYEGAAVDEAA
ncbi:acyl carrier protein [Methylobacterium oryzihabitans]|uniref:Acyl carrier protein n=1 Tax=Methylobacterium oryzihabitans TaxID=2499852 RepID=A0A3S2VNE7_9HYPH|nr:acyl carrier protein [Methylobacterium oryzihabitans]RVU16869.1 acyl carrier protein [Methylobacterium oryzihabitans]